MTIDHGRKTIALVLICALAGSTACNSPDVEDNEDDPEEVEVEAASEATQPVTWYDTGVHQGTTTLSLGDDDSQTCFLRGITGQFAGWDTLTVNETRGRVYRAADNYWVEAKKGHGIGIRTHYACISNVTNRYEITLGFAGTTGTHFINNSPTGNRMCFISGIEVNNGFSSSTDFVYVEPVESSWRVTGKLTPRPGIPYPGAGGTVDVTCVDMDSSYYTYTWWNGGTLNLTNMAGVACGMTRLDGNHKPLSTLGILDGLYAHKSSNWWQIQHITDGFSTPTKGIGVACAN